MKKTLAVFILILAIVQSQAQGPIYPKDIIVALDGSGNYKTIQEAVNSVRDFGQRVTIHIKKGIYHEKLVVPTWKTQITLLGEDKENTIITNNDYSGKLVPGGKDMFGKEKFTTFNSYTVLVQGNDFIAKNLTIENTSGRVGQAVALHIEGDRCVIENCRILGNQDTLYVSNEASRQYYKDCFIEGTTDFIFGASTAVFKNCHIHSKKNSHVTAASTNSVIPFGFVFFDCKLTADTNINKVSLGRPWSPTASVTYINCWLGNHIIPAGWDNWKNPANESTARYAEYNSTGPGAKPNERVKWAKQLSAEEAKRFTVKNILGEWDPEKLKT